MPNNYYLRPSFDAPIEGPIALDDINDRLEAGELNLDNLATPDLGESFKRVQGLPRHSWAPLKHTPGVIGAQSAGEESAMAVRLRNLKRAFLFVLVIFLIALALSYVGSLVILGF